MVGSKHAYTLSTKSEVYLKVDDIFNSAPTFFHIASEQD